MHGKKNIKLLELVTRILKSGYTTRQLFHKVDRYV